ncbi:MAG: hypothetical protein WCO56_27430 [Verrucomicrobiota bacterium]
MIGTLQGFKLSTGSFGQQYTTIDGVTYLTWFNLADAKLKGLAEGSTVEYEVTLGPTVLCHSPRVEEKLASAKLTRVIGGCP